MVLINTRAPDFELKGFYEGKIKEFDLFKYRGNCKTNDPKMIFLGNLCSNRSFRPKKIFFGSLVL